MKNKTWMKFRHRVTWKVLYWPVYLLTWIKYHARLDKFKDAKKRQYLILMNHQTPYDQFFVSMSFATPLYFIATEDIFSLGFPSSLLKYLVAPIPIKKFTTDLQAMKNCLKVVKEGGNICLAPEGNTTYSGHTGYMKPGIVSMAKKFGLPVVIYKIEGGYGKHPRWADDIRKGQIHAGVSRVIEPEEYKKLSDADFLTLIGQELYVNECKIDTPYRSKHLAEYMERAIYVCPDCGLSTFESHGDLCTCKKCGKTVRYLEDKTIQGEGFVFPFRFMSEWYDYQCDFINGLDIRQFTGEALYEDTVDIYRITPCVSQKLYRKGAKISLFGDRMEMTVGEDQEKETWRFEDFDGAAVMGRNKLEISVKGQILQFRGSVRFNALKYLNFYHRYKNICKGDENVKFLGL